GIYMIIPLVVLRQLDALKRSPDPEKAFNARWASREIEYYMRSGELKIENSYIPLNILENPADNKVVGTALWLKREQYKRPWLVTTDINMRIAALSVGVDAVDEKYLRECITVARLVSEKRMYLELKKELEKCRNKKESSAAG
ncbi:MAG: PIN domain-containing protein, partial [Thermofilum sp.]